MRELEQQSSSGHQALEGQQELSMISRCSRSWPRNTGNSSAQRAVSGRATREDLSEATSRAERCLSERRLRSRDSSHGKAGARSRFERCLGRDPDPAAVPDWAAVMSTHFKRVQVSNLGRAGIARRRRSTSQVHQSRTGRLRRMSLPARAAASVGALLEVLGRRMAVCR